MNIAKNVFLILLVCVAGDAHGQVITTFAGIGGSSGFSGDGGPAPLATLASPSHLEVDAGGNVYIADFSNSRIRKVSTSGIITTVVGNGIAGNSGDGGMATAASIVPAGIAIDHYGDLLVASDNGGADTSGAWIRKVDAAGVITTIAGNGTRSGTGDGGLATAAGFSAADIATDTTGNIYIADIANNRIRKINIAGIITTLAGNGTAGNGGDGGLATAAELSAPYSITTDRAGNVYIDDRDNNRIRKVNTSGIITAFAGTGTMGYSGDGYAATAAEIDDPFGVGTDAEGNIYLADDGNHHIRMVNTAGIITTVDSGASFDFPTAVVCDGTGNIYVADGRLDFVQKIGVSDVAVHTLQPNNDGILALWPNPNKGSVTLTLSSAINETAQIMITNLAGEKVKECTVRTNTQTALQLNEPGLYFVTAATGQSIQSAQVVVR